MQDHQDDMPRRGFLSRLVMIPALVAAYGFFASLIIRFLYPKNKGRDLKPMFVAFSDKVPTGKSKAFFTPEGDQVILTNTGQLQKNKNHTYIAFSSRCPHLGCKVHYSSENQQFICPCHQGVFDQKGVALSGPPADAGQALSEYDVRVDGNSIYVLVGLA